MKSIPKFRHFHAQRLLALADFLNKLPPERFNYSQWVGENWQGKTDLSCGTTACALGWASTMPRFKRLGLYLQKSKTFSHCYYPALTSIPAICCSDDSHFYRLGVELFGLFRDEFDYLFVPDEARELSDEHGGFLPICNAWATPKQVAKHLRRFVMWKLKQMKAQAT